MEQRHKEYIAYYKARMKKYEGDPDYTNTYAAEKALYEAITTAPTLEEFGERVKEKALNVQVSVGLVKDEATLRADFYTRLNEPIRAAPHLEILENLAKTTYTDVLDLNTMVGDVETRWQIKIAMDETLVEEFYTSWKILEDIEDAEFSQVPERWKTEQERFVRKEFESMRQMWDTHTIPNARKMDPHYTPNILELYEARHRRKVPFEDAPFQRRVAGFRRGTGV